MRIKMLSLSATWRILKLVTHPASTTHNNISPDRLGICITDGDGQSIGRIGSI